MLLSAQSKPVTQNGRRAASGAGRAPLRVVALASRPSVRAQASTGGSRPDVTGSTPLSGAGTPIGSGYTSTPIGVPLGSSYTGAGGAGGAGIGGGPVRPVGTGGPGGSGPTPPNLPSGWNWNTVILGLLALGFAVPAWRYINRRFLMKPEPEHTLAKAEDAAADLKSDMKTRDAKNAGKGVLSSIKHATVDPVKDTVAAGMHAVKHSDTGRAVQHKAEDIKDSADIATYDATSKTDRAVEKTKKNVKHAVENVSSNVKDASANVDQKTHEATVKGSRGLKRGKDKIEDAVYDAEVATGKATKGMLEGVKGAATSVGRKLHLVADSTEKGIKKGANATERALGVNNTPLPATSTTERTKYYIAGGAVVGTGLLAAALYYYDRKGGDIKQQVKKFQDKTKKAADTVLHRTQQAMEPAPTTTAKPPSAF